MNNNIEYINFDNNSSIKANIFEWNHLPFLKKGWIQCNTNNILIKENWNRKQWNEFIDTIGFKCMGLTIKGGLQMKPSNDKKKLYKKCKNLIIENLIIENGEHFLTINENNNENKMI
jgi:hypothetical protein